MSFDDTTYEQIASYLHNQMNEAEKNAFEALLKNDQELAAFVATLTSLESVYNEDTWNIQTNATVAEVKALAQEFRSEDVMSLSQKIRAIQHQKEASTPAKSKKSYFYVISSAVAIAAVMTLFYFSFMQSLTPTEAFEQYHNWNELPSFVKKSDNTNVEDLRIVAQLLYQDKKYAEALGIFQEYSQQNTAYDPNTQLYMGLCHLALKNFEEALNIFEELRNSDTLDNHKAYWYSAMVYLQLGDGDAAKKILQQLVQDANNYNYEKAKELLKKLE